MPDEDDAKVERSPWYRSPVVGAAVGRGPGEPTDDVVVPFPEPGSRASRTGSIDDTADIADIADHDRGWDGWDDDISDVGGRYHDPDLDLGEDEEIGHEVTVHRPASLWIRLAKAVPVALWFILRAPFRFVAWAWTWLEYRGFLRLAAVFVGVSLVATLVVLFVDLEPGQHIDPVWSQRSPWMRDRPTDAGWRALPPPAPGDADGFPFAGPLTGRSKLRPPVYERHTLAEARGALDVPGNAFLLRPRLRHGLWLGFVTRLARPGAIPLSPVPDLSKLPPAIVSPDVALPPPVLLRPAPPVLSPTFRPHAPRFHVGGLRPYCRQGEPCADDYPLGAQVTDVGLDAGPDTLGMRMAAAAGLPWGKVTFRLPSGAPYAAAPWDMTVDASGKVVGATRVSLALGMLAGVAFMAWAAGWLVERTLAKAWVFDWEGDFATLVNRLLSGVAVLVVAHMALGDEVLDPTSQAWLPMLLVPFANRTRGRLMAVAFSAGAAVALASIPVGPPVEALVAAYGRLGVGTWDVVGTAALAILAAGVALAGGARHLPVEVRVSGGRPLVQDVRVVR